MSFNAKPRRATREPSSEMDGWPISLSICLKQITGPCKNKWVVDRVDGPARQGSQELGGGGGTNNFEACAAASRS